jgi:lipopolysaccharide biosynthesis glycosyltransferase
MSKIDRILIGCNKNDAHLVKICVSSIRYWCPDISIYLIKDELNGAFNTTTLECLWDVKIYTTPLKKLGWGINTLLPLITKTKYRCLYLDADIVFLGDVLKPLQNINSEVIVSPDQADDIEYQMGNAYFSLADIQTIDPSFQLPNFLFNCGHLVYNEGLLDPNLLDGLIDWTSTPPSIINKKIFKYADQSILNFLFQKMKSTGQLNILTHDFNIWGFDSAQMDSVSLSDIKERNDTPTLIHWAGRKTAHISGMTRADILAFYEDIYYSKIKLGSLKKHYSHFIQHKKEYVLTFKKALVWVRDNVLKS